MSAPPSPPPPRVRFRSVSKHFGSIRALDDVSFDVAPGEIHALVGENGAGKSTLVKVLAGAERPAAGVIELDGRPLPAAGPRAAQAAGVAIVYQEFNLIPHLSVAENVYLGRWPRRRCGLIDTPALQRQTAALLASLALPLPVDRPVAQLSVAQQQGVEIAKALALAARVLILDEPSAVLTPHELAALFLLVRGLKARGVSVLYISHRLDEVFELADRVTVLRDGRHVATRPIAAYDRRQLIADCVGRPLAEEFPQRQVTIGPPVLRVERLAVAGVFSDVSFEVRAGEVLALAGLVGSGRSSVARALFGALRVTSGAVLVGDLRGPFSSPQAALRAGLMFVPEDRRRSGLLLQRPLRENLLLAHRRDAATAGLMRPRRERAIGQRLISELGIRTRSLETLPATLSGGNQQKALLARGFARPYAVLLLDEPTRGVDVGAKAEIYGLISRLAAQGVAVLMISSELPEVIALADRIGVMHRGRLVGILENARRDVTQETLLRLAVGEAGSPVGEKGEKGTADGQAGSSGAS